MRTQQQWEKILIKLQNFNRTYDPSVTRVTVKYAEIGVLVPQCKTKYYDVLVP